MTLVLHHSHCHDGDWLSLSINWIYMYLHRIVTNNYCTWNSRGASARIVSIHVITRDPSTCADWHGIAHHCTVPTLRPAAIAIFSDTVWRHGDCDREGMIIVRARGRLLLQNIKILSINFFLAVSNYCYADYRKGYDMVTGMGEMTDKKVSYIYHFIFTFPGYITNKFNGHLPIGLQASSTGLSTVLVLQRIGFPTQA